MTKDDICWLSATALAKAMRRKQLSPVERFQSSSARSGRCFDAVSSQNS